MFGKRTTSPQFRRLSSLANRIPMPFWSVPTSNTSTGPYITGSWPRLLRAVSWASKYDISVIIDIHGAPGSQNGYDNSGQKMGYPQWQTSPNNVNHTLQVFQALLAEFSQNKWGGTVGAIEALNEPAGFYPDVLAATNQYWKDGYNILADIRLAKGSQSSNGTVDPDEIKMAIMDGFQGVQNYQGFLTPPTSQGVIMDTVSESRKVLVPTSLRSTTARVPDLQLRSTDFDGRRTCLYSLSNWRQFGFRSCRSRMDIRR